MTDNELIKGIRENSSVAWKEIYQSNREKIRAAITPMLVRVKDADFDDVFELALLDLMDNVKDGKLVESEQTNLSGYLYTICWRIANQMVKKEKRRVGIFVEKADVEMIDEGDSSIDSEDYEEALAFLDRVLDSIPAKCKSILRRFYWDRLPMTEIAATHGLKNENSAKTTKNRCMEKFKEIAKGMLADDAKAENAVRRTVERNALRDLLEEFRKEVSGEWSIAALKDKDKE